MEISLLLPVGLGLTLRPQLLLRQAHPSYLPVVSTFLGLFSGMGRNYHIFWKSYLFYHSASVAAAATAASLLTGSSDPIFTPGLNPSSLPNAAVPQPNTNTSFD